MRHIVLYDPGSVKTCEDLPPTERATYLAVLGSYWEHLHFYREDGTELRARADPAALPPASWWRRLRNPWVTVPLSYEPVGPYALEDVKQKILGYLPTDDDIVTQFLDGDQIQKLLAQSDSFGDLLDAVRAIEGAHELDPALATKLRRLGILAEDEDE